MNNYELWQEQSAKEWEARCLNCGACCGASEDPCEHLRTMPDGRSSCLVYEARFGEHRTISGKTFRCVPIRQKRGQSWPGDGKCPYRRF